MQSQSSMFQASFVYTDEILSDFEKLYHLKGSLKLMTLSQERRLAVRKNTSQIKRLPVIGHDRNLHILHNIFRK